MIMSSCSVGVKEKMGFATRDKLNLQMADKIVAFINDSDVNGLYNLFSEEVKENNSKLNSDVKLLIDYLDESIDSYEEWAVGSKTSVEYGKNSTVYYSRFTMKVNNVDYFLHYIYYPKNDFDVNREGIRTIMEQVKSAPEAGKILPIVMNDTKNGWLANDGWVKMAQNVNGIEIHYIKNTITDIFTDFKFK